MSDVSFWGVFSGTVVGLVAGAFIQYGAQRLFIRWQRQGLLDGFKRELEYDIPVIERFINESGKLRAAAGANALGSYFGFFKLTDVFFVLASRALGEGLLYEFIDQRSLIKLQQAANFFNAPNENWVAAQIQSLKQGSGDALNFANFLEQQLVEHRDNLRDIIRAVADKRVRLWQLARASAQ